MSTPAPFVIQPYLTSIALAHRNAKLIADAVLPRIPVGSPVFKYNKYTTADAFTVPSTLVGRKGKPNEIDWSATETTDATKDYGLEDPIPNYDVEAARAVPGAPIDPQGRSTEILTDLIMLDREVRVANLIFGSGNYPAANKSTLSGNAQWSYRGDASNTPSDPITDIMTAMDGMLARPNVAVLGRATATQLQMNPRILKAFNGTLGDTGIVPLDFIARLFGLDDILVGEAWVNTAKKGQTATVARAWGKHAALLHINPQVVSPTQGGITFGFTAAWGSRIAGTRQDPDIGLRGGTRVRVGESVQEVIAASDCGYLFTNAVA